MHFVSLSLWDFNSLLYRPQEAGLTQGQVRRRNNLTERTSVCLITHTVKQLFNVNGQLFGLMTALSEWLWLKASVVKKSMKVNETVNSSNCVCTASADPAAPLWSLVSGQ